LKKVVGSNLKNLILHVNQGKHLTIIERKYTETSVAFKLLVL